MAGHEVIDLPIGFWSITIHFLIFSVPYSFVLQEMFSMAYISSEIHRSFSASLSIGTSVSETRLDLPLPETPAIPVIMPRGILAVIFFRLCVSAPFRTSSLPVSCLVWFLVIKLLLSARNGAVFELWHFRNLLYSPSKIFQPPLMPASGPISII